jgi:hypothetical protein
MKTLTSRYDRLPFSPLFQFLIRKPLLLNDTDYSPGDVIDRTDGIDDRKLRELYEGRFIDVRPDADDNPVVINTPAAADKPEPAKKTAKAKKASKAAQAAGAPEGGATPPDDAASGDAQIGGGLTAKHEGFGKWFVMAGDVKVSGPHTKDEAQKKAGAKA